MGIRLRASIIALTVCWLLVGLPLVAAGERIFQLPALVFVLGVGLAGALVMALPSLLGVLTNGFVAAGRVVCRSFRLAVSPAAQRNSRGDARTARSNAQLRM